jgi:glycosyltransferase involved in cell wall biosynthesis
MFVYNNCSKDARVLKEARTLAMAGHQVRVIAVLDRTTKEQEWLNGFEVVRIERDPLHYKLLRGSRWIQRWIRLSRRRISRWVKLRVRRVRVRVRAAWARPRRALRKLRFRLRRRARLVRLRARRRLIPIKRRARLLRLQLRRRLVPVKRRVRLARLRVRRAWARPRRALRKLRFRLRRRARLVRLRARRRLIPIKRRARLLRLQLRRLSRKPSQSRRGRALAFRYRRMRRRVQIMRESWVALLAADGIEDAGPLRNPLGSSGGVLGRVLGYILGVAAFVVAATIRASRNLRGLAARTQAAVSRGLRGLAIRVVGLRGRQDSAPRRSFGYRLLMRFHKPLMFIDYYWRAFKVARKWEPTTVHAHDLLTLPAAVALKLRTHCRVVYDAHELYPEISTLSRREKKVWQVLERALIGYADEVITVCSSIATELTQRYRLSIDPIVLHNCSPTHALASQHNPALLRSRFDIQGSPEPIILYQGGFIPNRGLSNLIRAAHHLNRGLIALMGWGRLEGELTDLIASEGLKGRVLIAPPVPQKELLDYTAAAAVGVIPYENVGLNNFYSAPNKLFEYIAAGVPIAGSCFPEIRRVVEGFEIGATFNPTEPRDIATAIDIVLTDMSEGGDMRANVATAARQLCWEQESTKLLKLYAAPSADPKATERLTPVHQ